MQILNAAPVCPYQPIASARRALVGIRASGGSNQRIGSCLILVARFRATSLVTEISGEEGVNVRLGEADYLGREFDEGQAALFHQVVNRPLADIQSPRDLRLGFVVPRSAKICSFRG